MKPKSLGWLVFACGVGAAMLLAWYAFPAVLYRSVKQPWDFNHRLHTGPDCDLSCEHCHGFEKNGRFRGIPSFEICTECHKDSFAAATGEVSWHPYIRLPDNAWFPHSTHVRIAKIPCEKCHGNHADGETLPILKINRISGYSRSIWGEDISGILCSTNGSMKMSDCEDCHRSSSATTACQDCHR